MLYRSAFCKPLEFEVGFEVGDVLEGVWGRGEEGEVGEHRLPVVKIWCVVSGEMQDAAWLQDALN